MVLAIDIGKKMGWAYHNGHTSKLSDVKSGTITLKGVDIGDLLISMSEEINKLYRELKFTAIAYEDVIYHKGVYASHMYGAFRGLIHVFCKRNKLDIYPYNVKTIKKVTAGVGNASKDLMIASVRVRGFSPKTHDEADAIGILITHFSSQETR